MVECVYRYRGAGREKVFFAGLGAQRLGHHIKLECDDLRAVQRPHVWGHIILYDRTAPGLWAKLRPGAAATLSARQRGEEEKK